MINPKKQMPTLPFWGDVGVKQWSPNFCLGTQNAILLFPKMVTFAKSAHFYALKSGTLGAQTKNPRPLLLAQHPQQR